MQKIPLSPKMKGKEIRVLVVEDEKSMNRLISEAMEDEKYSVRH
jgi:CheY-like chemotaxis protein